MRDSFRVRGQKETREQWGLSQHTPSCYRKTRAVFWVFKSTLKMPLFVAAEGQGAGNHGSGAERGGEEVVFKWGELPTGGTHSSTLAASSAFFVHSAYCGRELNSSRLGSKL